MKKILLVCLPFLAAFSAHAVTKIVAIDCPDNATTIQLLSEDLRNTTLAHTNLLYSVMVLGKSKVNYLDSSVSNPSQELENHNTQLIKYAEAIQKRQQNIDLIEVCSRDSAAQAPRD